MRRPKAQGIAPAVGETWVVAPDVSPAALDLPVGALEVSLLDGRPGATDGTVVVAVRDGISLRRAASTPVDLGSAEQVSVWFEREPSQLPSPSARPGTPRLESVHSSRSPNSVVTVTYERPVPVRAVLADLARGLTTQQLAFAGWPVLGIPADTPDLVPAADLSTLAPLDATPVADEDYPPDVSVVDGPERPVHDILGRPPVNLVPTGPVALGPLDEQLLNPRGFHRASEGQAVPMLLIGGSHLSVTTPDSGEVRIDLRHGLSETDLPRLRQTPGLRLEWPDEPSARAYCRVVAGLAMAGVPLASGTVPAWARELLHADVVTELESEPDLGDVLAREVHSVRLRRAALLHHSNAGWRRAVGAAAGAQTTAPATVSVLLATRRPEQVTFALRQVARQCGVEMSLVLVTHGFDPSPRDLDDFRATSPIALSCVTAPSGSSFGASLNLGLRECRGEVVLKMDDDDWYGPDFVLDLLLARGYSSADMVGCHPEFTFVEPLWMTTRRRVPAEQYRPLVAGGTMMIDRATLVALGGFRDTRKHVDACLHQALVAAGGTIYRTHGLSYVLRRAGDGHTWDPGLGYFVERDRTWYQWRGFRPSPLVEVDPRDLPTRPVPEVAP